MAQYQNSHCANRFLETCYKSVQACAPIQYQEFCCNVSNTLLFRGPSFPAFFDASNPQNAWLWTHPQKLQLVQHFSALFLKIAGFGAFIPTRSPGVAASSAHFLKTLGLQCFHCIHPYQNLQKAMSLVHSLKNVSDLKCCQFAHHARVFRFAVFLVHSSSKIPKFCGVSSAVCSRLIHHPRKSKVAPCFQRNLPLNLDFLAPTCNCSATISMDQGQQQNREIRPKIIPQINLRNRLRHFRAIPWEMISQET